MTKPSHHHGGSDHGGHAGHGTTAQATTPTPKGPFYSENDAAMARMHKDMHEGPFSGDVDQDFLAMMVPHHQGAIDMAALVLRHGRDPLVRRIAEDIMAGQQIEIDAMRGRLAILSGGGASANEFPALGGTRGPKL